MISTALHSPVMTWMQSKRNEKIIKKGAKIERFTKSREDAIAYFQEKMNHTR